MNNNHRSIFFPSLAGRGRGWACLFFIILLASCGPQKGRLRIRGEFENLPQADLLLYSPDGGIMSIDTLHILKGRFEYETRPEDGEPHTYVIIYPNFSTLSFMARSGSDIRIEGDALSLSQVKVEGADSLVSDEPRRGKSPLAIGKKLPKSSIIKQKAGHYLFIGFWADWKHGSNAVNYNTRLALRQHPDSLTAFTYSLDLQPAERPTNDYFEDSLRWRTYCDYQGWGGPLVSKLGIRNIPYMILLDPKGTVIAMGCDFNRDISPALQKIQDKQ